MTECITEPITFSSLSRQKIQAEFNGGRLTSDGGALLLRQVDRRLELIKEINDCIPDPRHPALITHQQRTLLAQRIFGIALGPCTFAYLAPMLAVAFKAGTGSMLFGILLLLLYGIGHTSVIALAGSSTERVQRYLNWNDRSHGMDIVRKICGVLVLLVGLYLLWIS